MAPFVARCASGTELEILKSRNGGPQAGIYGGRLITLIALLEAPMQFWRMFFGIDWEIPW